MVTFIHEGNAKIELQDRALTHLQLVMIAKLRPGEPFRITGKENISVDGGRETAWTHARSALVLECSGNR